MNWDLTNSLWTSDHLHLFDQEQRGIVDKFQRLFKSQHQSYKELRKQIVHNDVNDLNIVVSQDLRSPRVNALIDFGDAVHTQAINDLAIACAYAMMHF